MTESLVIASLVNLAGPDLILLFFFVLIPFGAVGGLVLLVVFLLAKWKAAPPPFSTTEARLRELGELKQRNVISEAEYEEQRRRILSEG
jgi:hypothetical protein